MVKKVGFFTDKNIMRQYIKKQIVPFLFLKALCSMEFIMISSFSLSLITLSELAMSKAFLSISFFGFIK